MNRFLNSGAITANRALVRKAAQVISFEAAESRRSIPQPSPKQLTEKGNIRASPGAGMTHEKRRRVDAA
jgi:hypothetical protein